MNIKNIINQIIDLDNENKFLKAKLNLNDTNYKVQNKIKNDDTDILNQIKDEIFLIGLEKTIDYNSFFNYIDVFNKDTRNFLKVEEWLKSITIDDYYRRNFPKSVKENLNNKEIINLYTPYLKKFYEKLVNEEKVNLMKEAKEVKEQNG